MYVNGVDVTDGIFAWTSHAIDSSEDLSHLLVFEFFE